MSRQSLLAGSLIFTIVIAGCTTHEPFTVSQEQFFAKTKTIALVPVTVPEGLEDAEPVKIKFESMIAAKLRDAGFVIVPSQEYSQIYRRVAEQGEAYPDSMMSEKKEAHFKELHETTCKELCTQFKVDAILYPSIGVVTAEWLSGRASWWGTSESVEPITQAYLRSLFMSTSGTVPALVLRVVVTDVTGSQLYTDGGGIQVLSKLSGLKTFVPVQRHELFVNEDRNSKAVNLALEKLLMKPTPKQ